MQLSEKHTSELAMCTPTNNVKVEDVCLLHHSIIHGYLRKTSPISTSLSCMWHKPWLR